MPARVLAQEKINAGGERRRSSLLERMSVRTGEDDSEEESDAADEVMVG